MTTTEEYIIYGVAGGLVFLAILFVIIFCCVYYRKKKEEEKEEKIEEQQAKEEKRKEQHRREKDKQKMRALEAQQSVGMNPAGAYGQPGFYGQPVVRQSPGKYDLLTVRHSNASFASSTGLNFDMVPPGSLLQHGGPPAGYPGYRGPTQVQVHPSPQRHTQVREITSSDEYYSSDDESKGGRNRRDSQSSGSDDSDASKPRRRRNRSDSDSNYSSDSSYDRRQHRPSQTQAVAIQPPVVYGRQPINARVPVPQVSGYPTVGYAPGGQPVVYTTQPMGMTPQQAAMNRALAGPDGYYNRGVIFRNAPYMPTHALNPNQGLSSSAPTRLSGYVPAPSNPPINLSARIEPGWGQQHYNMSMAALRQKGDPIREPQTMALSKFAPYWANKVQPLENHQTQWQYYKDWRPLQ